MKFSRFALVLLAAAILVPHSHAQTPEEMELMTPEARAARLELAQDELATLERETARALLQRNATFFRRVYSDDFIGVISSGRVLDKNALLSFVQNFDVLYTSFVVSNIRVRIYKETAVVTCTWNSIAQHEGRSVGQQARVTHVYVYGQRGWQAVSSQETLLPG